MPRLYINSTLEKSIRTYCEMNNIDDINAFANRCAKQGLDIIKFGLSPTDNVNRENKGIKDIIKNDKRQTKQKSFGEDIGKREEEIGGEKGKEDNKEKEIEPKEERKENITVRRIQVIKKK